MTLSGSAMRTLTSASRALAVASLLDWPSRMKALGDLAPDPQRRVHRRNRILVHHRHSRGPQLAQLAIRDVGDVGAGELDAAAGDQPIARQIAQRCVGRGALPTTRFADEAIGLTGLDIERDATKHFTGDTAHHVGEFEDRGLAVRTHRPRSDRGLELQRCRSCVVGGPVQALLTRSSVSATRLTAMTRVAIASAGKSVGHQTSSWMRP